MSLISEKTIDDFGTWAKENADKGVFPKIYETEKSYYINRNSEEAYLVEYSFRNMVELKQALEVYSGLSADSQILEKMTVEVCKNRGSHAAEIKADKSLLQKEEPSVEEPVKMPAKAGRDLRNEKFIEEFQAWAKENTDNTVFPEISKEEDSYYNNRSSKETYMVEYSFKNMAELKETLGKYSGLEREAQILKKLMLAICQNKVKSDLKVREMLPSSEKNKEASDEKKTLPEFVYVF